MASLFLSSELVISSKINKSGFLISALAIPILCFWPPDIFFSLIILSLELVSSLLTKSSSWASLRHSLACSILSIVYLSSINKLSIWLPLLTSLIRVFWNLYLSNGLYDSSFSPSFLYAIWVNSLLEMAIEIVSPLVVIEEEGR